MAPKKHPPDLYAAKYLLFVDTSISLDPCRRPTGESLAETLTTLEHARDRMISTAQVQMEFMKNRQKPYCECSIYSCRARTIS